LGGKTAILLLGDARELSLLGGGRLVRVSAALSGGSLRQYLRETVSRHGAARVMLELPVLRMDFPIPCPGGAGDALPAGAPERLLRESGARAFYSEALCVNYFTRQTENGYRMTLFDDASSLRKKLFLARELSLGAAVLYEDSRSLWGEILR